MRLTSIATVIVFLLLSVATASAQTCPGREEPYDVKLSGVQKGPRQFNIFTTYCLKEITAGRVVTVTVRIETEQIPGSPPLEIKGLPALNGEDAERIKFSQTDPETDDKSALSIRKYNYTVQISESAEPRKYMVQLDLGFPDNNPDKDLVRRAFGLPVGVNSNGKLEVSKEAQSDSFQAAMFSTANHDYTLKVRNLFRDYTAYVESITVNSDPAGWIAPITMTPAKDEEWNIAPTGEKTFTFKFDTTPLSGNLIRGFSGTPPKLKFDILYNDGFRRQLTYDQGRQPMTISPSIWVLVGAVLLGLLFGAIVRGVLEFMYFKKKISRPAVIRIATYSLLFGLLVVLLTLAGQVEVKSKAFSLSGSYDNPLVMLVIGLVSALAGLQIFTGWYKSLQSE
jgi:hypothetical protein